jgi:serine/threonine-protein kinase
MDFGRLPNGSLYLLMKYVKGTSLKQLIKHGPFAPARALEIARQSAEAIKFAHDAGVINRDLKQASTCIDRRRSAFRGPEENLCSGTRKEVRRPAHDHSQNSHHDEQIGARSRRYFGRSLLPNRC